LVKLGTKVNCNQTKWSFTLGPRNVNKIAHVVLFTNPTTMVGPSLPLSPLYTQWVVLTQSFFYIL
jgi:hypothetical protein